MANEAMIWVVQMKDVHGEWFNTYPNEFFASRRKAAPRKEEIRVECAAEAKEIRIIKFIQAL